MHRPVVKRRESNYRISYAQRPRFKVRPNFLRSTPWYHVNRMHRWYLVALVEDFTIRSCWCVLKIMEAESSTHVLTGVGRRLVVVIVLG